MSFVFSRGRERERERERERGRERGRDVERDVRRRESRAEQGERASDVVTYHVDVYSHSILYTMCQGGEGG